MDSIPVGTKVGAGRWPYSHCHPDCWEKPWHGYVLAQNDVRAWTSTLAFYGIPTQEEVDAHVDWCKSQGLLEPHRVPVLWEFKDEAGRPYQQVYWETVGPGRHEVKPYEEDYALWLAERMRSLPALADGNSNSKEATDFALRNVRGIDCGPVPDLGRSGFGRSHRPPLGGRCH